MSRYIDGKYKNLKAYIPGEQPKPGSFIKLNTNESPFPPAPFDEKEALNVLGGLNIYNDTQCTALTGAFSDFYDIAPENVVFGNGSDEILAFCFLAYCGEKGIAYPEITYGFYQVLTDLYGVQAEQIPLNEDFTLRIEDYYRKGKTILIANPNAPTGITLSVEEIEAILRENPEDVVIVDEAYMGFGGETAIPLTKSYANLLVTGTFSKSRNLAGGRLGYAVGCSELIGDLQQIRCSYNPYNVNAMTQFMGYTSLLNKDYYTTCTTTIAENRQNFVDKLTALGFETLDSKANFVFTKSPRVCGKQLYQSLREKGILVRYFPEELTKDYLRISIGTREEMDKVIVALEEILEEQNGTK